MNPMQIKKSIQKLAQGMQEAEKTQYDHGLHAALEKLYTKHGAKKTLVHMAHMMHSLHRGHPAHDIGDAGQIAENIEGVLPDDGTVQAMVASQRPTGKSRRITTARRRPAPGKYWHEVAGHDLSQRGEPLGDDPQRTQ